MTELHDVKESPNEAAVMQAIHTWALSAYDKLSASYDKFRKWLTPAYDALIIVQLNVLLIGKILYDGFRDHILPFIYMMCGTAVYVWQITIKPNLLEYVKSLYLSVTLYFIIMRSYVYDQCEKLFKYGLVNWSDSVWEFLWQVHPSKKFKIFVTSPDPALKHKLLWAFSAGIYKLGESDMLNVYYIKYIMGQHELVQRSFDDTKSAKEVVDPITFVYRINGEQRLISLDMGRYMYLKDIKPSDKDAAVNWKRILFNRVPIY